MSRIIAPARNAIACPSPVATLGLVDSRKTCPQPPVHNYGFLAHIQYGLPPRVDAMTPWQRPSWVIKSIVNVSSTISTFGTRSNMFDHGSNNLFSVASPKACKSSDENAPPSRPRMICPSCVSKRVPQAISSLTRSGASFTTWATTSGSQRPAPATKVS